MSDLVNWIEHVVSMVNTIAMAGLCHDLGKKEIPKEILNEKGALQPEDRHLMEKHSIFGAQLLLEIPGVESTYPLLPVVAYQHHMGSNQSGYPKIQGRMPQYSLHFASLLVAVADVYDALRTVRPYRPALTVAKAATILIRDAFHSLLLLGSDQVNLLTFKEICRKNTCF